ncbi:hypothetical protein BUALT_Bualt01G0071200 [Buddleja alternifolia]|uniref:Beta-1,3-glucanase n=1 Tax=Buddleja alternifolia TaxID=168488 RepID=A0AAV6Y6H9_9LAMI|nr:hypothetical protein BUALT_Bualt01G0071200 [Buddleja alternifolia]
MERVYVLVLVFTCLVNIHPVAQAIGINYGVNGDNLPAPTNVISVLKQRNVAKFRLFEPNEDVLTALHDSGISVIVGTSNQDLETLATDYAIAVSWVDSYVLPHYSSVNITCIAAGNEVFPGDLAQYIPGAMKNLAAALSASNIAIPVSTAVSMQVLSVSYPPSQGLFSADATPVMTEITEFLQSKNSPLLLNAYTYFPRVGDPSHVQLEYALLQDSADTVHDDPYTYDNLFDAMVDAVYSAVEKVGGPDVEIIVTETGWPTDGGDDASIENAQTYVNNLIEHVTRGQGTPKRPGKDIDTYIFALFNEDLKPEGVERNWGLYYPNMTEVYNANF